MILLLQTKRCLNSCVRNNLSFATVLIFVLITVSELKIIQCAEYY